MTEEEILISRADLVRFVAKSMVCDGDKPPIKYITNQLEYLIRKEIIQTANKPTRGQALMLTAFECALFLLVVNTEITNTVSLMELLSACRRGKPKEEIFEAATNSRKRTAAPTLMITKLFRGENLDSKVKGAPAPVGVQLGLVIPNIGETKWTPGEDSCGTPRLGFGHVHMFDLYILLQPLRTFLGFDEDEDHDV